MITIIEKDILEDIGKYDAMIVGTNTYFSMYQGFQHEIVIDYPYVLDLNCKTKYGDISKMGTLLECKADNEPTFTLAYITKGLNTRPDLNNVYLSYEALESCLRLIDVKYKDKNIATSIIGSSRFDGNGDRDRILEMIHDIVKRPNMTIYDFYDKSINERKREVFLAEKAVKTTNYDLYHQMVKERKKKEKMRLERNGHSKT